MLFRARLVTLRGTASPSRTPEHFLIVVLPFCVCDFVSGFSDVAFLPLPFLDLVAFVIFVLLCLLDLTYACSPTMILVKTFTSKATFLVFNHERLSGFVTLHFGTQ